MTSVLQTKPSYKDILETFSEQVVEKPKEERHLTYDEWKYMMNEKKMTERIITKMEITQNNFIDEHLEQFINLCEVLKSNYNDFGYMNRMNYMDLANICVKNMNIVEIEDSESEDDESNDINIDD